MNKILFVLLLLGSQALLAQKFSVKGQVIDSSSVSLPSATVLLLLQKDSSLVNYAVSDAKGFFEIRNIPAGRYQLKVTFVGYASEVIEITSKMNEPVIDLGLIKMKPQSKELAEVTVMGEKAPVTVKRDTIEFNAGSFKTKANASVEDLLKKMPGIEVQSDGSIKAQGETVQRVMVDGKEFFGRDPKLATKNLPADAINKVQVFDKKSDQAVFTGIDDGQREKAINLELKEEKRNGMFGNIMGGAGTNDRFQAKANLNRFTKKRQFSFLGMGNNVNEQGFSIDDYMNFSGGSQQMLSGGAVRIEFNSENQNGVPLNFGGRQNGIMTNYAAGLNFNEDLNKKSKVNGSYFYNQLTQNITKSIHRVNYLPGDSSYYFDQQSAQLGTSEGHKANFTWDYKIDSVNSIKWNTTASNTYNTQRVSSHSATTTNTNQLVNESDRTTLSQGNNLNLTSNLLFRHKFAKKGRSMSANVSATISDSYNDGTLQANNDFYQTNETQAILQSNHQKTNNQTYGTTLTYTEPLGKRKYLEASYAFRTNQNEVTRDVYNLSSGQPVFYDSLSSRYKSNYFYNRPGLSFRITRKKYNLSTGVTWQATDLQGRLLLKQIDINRKFQNFLPAAHFNYDFSNFRHLRFDYETSMQEPTISQLQPVIDNSDPLNLTVGNPNLQPAYNHRMNFNFTIFDPTKFISFFTFLSANLTKNAFANSQTIDDKLVRTTKPVNVSDNLSLNGNFSFGFPIKPLNGRFSIGPNGNFSRGINLLNNQENTVRQQTLGGSIRYDYTLKEILFIGLSAQINRQKTEYDFNKNLNQVYNNNTYSAEGNLTFFKNFQLNSNLDYYIYKSETTNFSRDFPIWNISVSRFLLKNKTGELKFSVMNALDQSLSVNQTASTNYLQQETTNNLGRYFMVSFTYSLNKQLNPMGGGPGGGGMRVMIRN
jgi:hypothetical protein